MIGYAIGVDVGTGSVRAGVFSLDGRQVLFSLCGSVRTCDVTESLD